MTASLWNFKSGDEFVIIQERTAIDLDLPLDQSLENIDTDLISGTLPNGARLEGNRLVGTVFEVQKQEVFKFVIRAYYEDIFEDCTFIITVQGPDAPEWITNEGLLPVGTNNQFFVLDNQLVEYQLFALDSDLPAGDVLEYYIAEGDGNLPPGLELASNGKIQGITDPLLSLESNLRGGQFDTQPFGELPYDYAVVPSNGFGSFGYDSQVFGFSVATQSLKKLNRYYPFTVTVTDGETFVKRDFKIYLVGDDFLRSDNTIMQVGTGIFTADNTHIRTPVWTTPRDLGIKRANNYTTLYVEVINSSTLSGAVGYTLDNINDDGSRSELPPGMELDSDTGIIAGRVPYQPAITKTYKFTVRATRFTGDIETVTVFANFYEDTIHGTDVFKIYKIDLTGDQDGINDLAALRGRDILIENNLYKVLNYDDTNPDYDLIYLDKKLKPAIPLLLTRTAIPGQDYIFINRLTLSEKEKYQKRVLKFSDTENYSIEDIVPYIEYEIETDDFSTTTEDLEEVFGAPAYVKNTNQDVWRIMIPSTSTSRNLTKFKEVVNSTSSNTFLDIKQIIDNQDRVTFDVGLSRTITQGSNIGLSLFQNDFFSENIALVSTDEVDNPSKSKTFEVRILGEVDSTIKWITPSNLGTIKADRLSRLKVEAESTIQDSKIVYKIVEGKLPFGMSLNSNGEIIGKANQFVTESLKGLTTFDSGNASWDGSAPGDTTFDREYTFVVEAKDRFDYSASTQSFTLTINDLDKTKYTNLYIKPFLKSDKRQLYRSFVSNTNVFTPENIYRPSDPNYGLQTDIKALAYAGIEAKNINEFVAASAKNHKRKRFKLGEAAKAIAREPGTNNIVYEVIYVPVLDPLKSKKGKVLSKVKTQSNKKITADSVQLETIDDDSVNSFEPDRYRPKFNTIKADSNAVKSSASKDQLKYISNIDNMRNRISEIGIIEREFLPLWMRTAQEQYQELDYIAAFPVCFCLPGTADEILLNIKNSGFDFKKIDFDIDRYIIERTNDNDNEQYILFANYQFNIS